MLILSIRTDKPEAEVGLYENEKQLIYTIWPAHRELSKTLHQQIAKILQKLEKDWSDIEGVVCFKGPGSFTGLRIGLTVANVTAFSLEVPVVSSGGQNWIEQGLKRLLKGENEKVALPRYSSPAHITQPKK